MNYLRECKHIYKAVKKQGYSISKAAKLFNMPVSKVKYRVNVWEEFRQKHYT